MCFSEGSTLNLFADDMLLYKVIKSPEDLNQLQSDINEVHEWVSSNYLTLNPIKRKFMLISRKRNPIRTPHLHSPSTSASLQMGYFVLAFLLLILCEVSVCVFVHVSYE